MQGNERRLLLMCSATLLACTTTAAAQEMLTTETVVVTGSRIPRPGFTSNSPIATVDPQEISLQMRVDVEEVLRNQPQFASGNGAQVNNGSSGASTLDLRGLSEPRTLALIDGKRMVGFGPNGLFDVSAVPVALLTRVDVVTGGASAVYGSDAIAGVVNFILNDDFHGVDARASHSFNDLHDTGDSTEASFTMGAGLDNGRGNVALSLNWLDREPVYQIKGPAALAPGSSSTTDPAAFDSAVGGRTQLNDSGQLVPFYHGYNFNATNLFQAPEKRWGATALGRYKLMDSVEAYTRFIYQKSKVSSQLAPSGTFGFSFEVPLNNPFLTTQASNYLAANNPVSPCSVAAAGDCVTVGVRWRGVDVGPRQQVFDFDTFQALVGFRGDVFGEWKWDVSYAHGESSFTRQQNNDVDANRIQQALFAADANTCFDPSNGCAPLNILNPSSPPSKASTDFVRLNLQLQSRTTQEYVTGTISGDLGSFRSPLAKSPIGISFGTEYRKETSDFLPDAPSQAGTSPGFGATLPVVGDYDVLEFYGEMLVPLVEGAPFANAINLEFGYRTSDYSTSGRVESFKYGLDWQPISDLRFRGMYQRAVRAASIAELFSPFVPGTGDLLVDPCSGVTAAANPELFNLCVQTGVPNPATLSQPTSGQVNNFTGGNPNLKPETASTITLGLVFQPEEILGLSITVDYFKIKVHDAISVRPAFDILDGCYNPSRNSTLDPHGADCILIKRNAISGSLEGDTIYGVDQRIRNIGSVNVEGIDYAVRYAYDFEAWGLVAAGLEGTHLLQTNYSPSGDLKVDCLGFYGKTCGLPSTVSFSVGGPVSQDRWVQRTTWSLGDWELSYRWRHLSAVKVDELTRQGGAITGELDPNSLSIPDYDYLDFSVAWQATEYLRLSANITNITDRDAPFVFTSTGSTTFNSGNTYPSTYDVLGRVFTFGASARF